MKLLSNVLLILTFFLGLTTFAAVRPDDFLSEEKFVRVYVDSAPGFGHQSAGVSVMRRLRELGFRGEFEVIYQPVVAGKIQKIYPGFPTGIPGEVHYLSIGDYQKQLGEGRISSVKLAISGADDGFGTKFAKIARAETYLRLQPLGWGQAALYGKQSKVLHSLRNMPLTNLSTPNVSQFVEGLKSQNDLSLAKKDFVLRFAELAPHHASFPIYGVGTQAFSAQRMYFYGKAVKSAVQKTHPEKAVIVPVVSPFNEQEMDTLMKAFGKAPGFEASTSAEKKHQNQFHILNPEQFSMLTQVKPGHVYFVFVGAVPQNVFNFFYEQANLPVWVAGKNAMSFAASKGKVYFNTVNDYHLPGQENLSEESRKIMERAYVAFNNGYQEYANQGHLNNLSKFIKISSTPGTELRRFYTEIGSSMSANDKVLEGLRNMLGNPSVFMCREVFAP